MITNAIAEQVTMNTREIIWSATNWTMLPAKAEAQVASEMPITEIRKRRRRPIRSANGTSRKAGSAPRCTKPSVRPRSASATA